MCSQVNKSNKESKATGLLELLFTAYTGNFEKEHTLTKRTLASSNAKFIC